MPGEPPARHWLRLRFAKLGKIRFTSHRDVARAFERAVRRVGLPVAWTEGFSPRPLLSFGLALPTGAESLAEYLDIRLADPVDPSGLPGVLSSALPEGLGVLVAAQRPPGARSLQQEVTSCSWELEVVGLSREELSARIEALLGSQGVLVTRSRKGTEATEDLRPAILGLALVEHGAAGGEAVVSADLATAPRGVRPSELLEGLGPGASLRRARRTQQWIDEGGTRREPLVWPGGAPGTAAGAVTNAEEPAP